MSKKVCRECMKKVRCHVPVVKRVDGTIEWVCKECWGYYGYSIAMNETEG